MLHSAFSKEYILQLYQESQFECISITFGFALFYMLVHLVKDQSGTKLGFTYQWFLFNGVWIHLFIDGIIALLNRIPPMYYLYQVLDDRFSIKEPTVMAVSTVEMIFMGPVCILIAILCKTTQQQQGYKNVLIIVVSIVQIAGTIVFVYNEYSRDLKDVCRPFGCFSFTTENIIFFWLFFVAANPVWIFVPLWEISKAIKQLKTPTPTREKKQRKKD